jgi:signal transduction histidine kinase
MSIGGGYDGSVNATPDSQGRRDQDRIEALERELRERTRERDEIASELATEREMLAHAISHDLRAPVRAMDGFARVLEEECAAPLRSHSGSDCTEYLQFIRRGSRQLMTMLEGLIELVRTMPPKAVVTVDAGACVRAAIGIVHTQWEARSSSPLPAIDVTTLPPCMGDAEQLKVLWVRLIENAYQATRDVATPTIEIDGWYLPDADDAARMRVTYRIRDNGCGFESGCAEELFRPFRSLHGRGQFDGSGVGLGLALAQRIARVNQGRIEGSALPEGGAAFTVNLPAPPTT